MTTLTIPAGVIMGAVELVLRQDLPESFVRSVQQVEDDDVFLSSYLSVYS